MASALIVMPTSRGAIPRTMPTSPLTNTLQQPYPSPALLVCPRASKHSAPGLSHRGFYRRRTTAMALQPDGGKPPAPGEDASLGSFATGATNQASSSSPAPSTPALSADKPSGGEMLKLFQDAQDNMLFLNKQRLIALEELAKVERDREFLMAKVAQLEAENNASAAEREVLEQKLRVAEAEVEMAMSRAPQLLVSSTAGSPAVTRRPGKADPPAAWSALLLRVDALLQAGLVNEGQATALRGLAISRDVHAAEVYEELKGLSDQEISRPLLKLLDGSGRKLHVVHICAELAPVAQAGSLGTWVLGLSRAMRRKGHLVEVVMPLYGCMDTTYVDDFREHSGELHSFFEDSWHPNKIWTGTVYGVPVTFIQPLHPAKFFDRDRLYGFEDDFERFTYFSRAALEYMLKQKKNPDVLHLHDWQTAISAPLFWDIFHHQGLTDTRLLFTCHDVLYQNAQPASKLAKIGLDPGQLNRPDRLQDPGDPALVNLVKGGVVYSNKVTTVSPLYAVDVKTRDGGCGLDGTFTAHSNKFVGISSGLDDSEWDPQVDPALPLQITADTDFLVAKAAARGELRRQLGLPSPADEGLDDFQRPVVACLAPSLTDSDVALVQAAVETVLRNGAQFVFVGASRAPKAQAALEDMQREIEDPNAKFVIHYERDLAHMAVGAAHMLLCLSRRDHSTQMLLAGLRYGALPVARQPREGGSRLVDVHDQSKGRSEGVGFLFAHENPAEVSATLDRAISFARSKPEDWTAATARALALDGSWDGGSSQGYIDAYWSIKGC